LVDSIIEYSPKIRDMKIFSRLLVSIVVLLIIAVVYLWLAPTPGSRIQDLVDRGVLKQETEVLPASWGAPAVEISVTIEGYVWIKGLFLERDWFGKPYWSLREGQDQKAGKKALKNFYENEESRRDSS